MTTQEAEDKLVFLETTEEEKAHGLRRIKRRHYTGPPELLDQEVQLARLREDLLNDEEFVERLREKLAA
ncbi:MAG TPA: hypothetical protein VNA17_00490 [Pyrinomonadaceae bacterium]|nr:hypothetical protein [Pyrinomonadaceae bacterium]